MVRLGLQARDEMPASPAATLRAGNPSSIPKNYFVWEK